MSSESNDHALLTAAANKLILRPSYVTYGNYAFILMDAPTDTTLPYYLAILRARKVKTVVRACEATYRIDQLQREGIEVVSLDFPDGEAPPEDILKSWRELRNRVFGRFKPEYIDATAIPHPFPFHAHHPSHDWEHHHEAPHLHHSVGRASGSGAAAPTLSLQHASTATSSAPTTANSTVSPRPSSGSLTSPRGSTTVLHHGSAAGGSQSAEQKDLQVGYPGTPAAATPLNGGDHNSNTSGSNHHHHHHHHNHHNHGRHSLSTSGHSTGVAFGGTSTSGHQHVNLVSTSTSRRDPSQPGSAVLQTDQTGRHISGAVRVPPRHIELDPLKLLPIHHNHHTHTTSAASAAGSHAPGAGTNGSACPLCENRPIIALHCIAGLGRAPLLVAVALIDAGLAADEVIRLIRFRRKGAFNSTQIGFLQTYTPPPQGGCCSIV